MDKAGLDGVTQRIIGCAFTVANRLGVGFAKKLYENALVLELRKLGLAVEQQVGIAVRYDDVVIVESKVATALNDQHFAQCVNYLRATEKHLCLPINFGRPRIEIRRVVLNL